MTTPLPHDEKEEIREIERARLRALVAGDIPTAEQLHSDEFQLVTPVGALLTKREYLGAIATGHISYLAWEPGPIDVRVYDAVATIRYPAQLEVVFGGHHVASTRYWHTDSYERTSTGWRAVWSQATEIR